MEDTQSPTKLTNAKKNTPPTVESTINQRPRRKIKHKFIKCNRDSPDKVIGADYVDDVSDLTDLDMWIPSTSQATIPKTKTQPKHNSKKNARLSGRQNRCKESVTDIDDSSLQMVEIIDDPSDDPNVSIEEIIETCVLDAEEYQRMVNCTDSVSNTTNSVADLSDGNLSSAEKAMSQCIQNSCDRQISVGLVDCMKDKNMLKRLTLDERNVDDTDQNNTIDDVLNKSLDEVKEIVEIQPSTEFCSPIRTRRVTRLSTRRPTDTKLISSLQPSPKSKIEAFQSTEVSKINELQTPVNVERSENQTNLEETIIKIDSIDSGDISTNKCENTEKVMEITISTDSQEKCAMPNENKTDELTNTSEVRENSSEIFVEEIAAEIRLEHSQCEIEADDISSLPVLKQDPDIVSTGSVDTVQITEESECEERVISSEKAKERIKIKKERKRISEKHNVNFLNEEEKPQTLSESQSTEQNKIDFITFMEKKFQDSDPSKQIQHAIADESDGIQKPDSSGDTAKIVKNKKKRDNHSDHKSKRSSDPSKKLSDSHKSCSNSKQSTLSDKRSKDSKDSKPAASKGKHNSTMPDLPAKKSHKRENPSNRTERDIVMDQLRAIEQKTANRNKSTVNSQHSQKELCEKGRDSSVKSKIKSTPDTIKSKSKTKDIISNDAKDEKSLNSKVVSDQGSSNRKSQQQTTPASRSNSKSNRCGTDVILSECYLPKQVKYDESLYSIEALKAAQAAQEEQMKIDAEKARKAKEILAVKEEQAKAARAAARLAKQEEAKALERAKIEAEKAEKAEAEKAIKLAKAAAKAARSKQSKEINGNLNMSN